MKRVKIEVKKKHIKNGKIDSTTSCPLALAVKDRYPLVGKGKYPCGEKVLVFGDSCYIEYFANMSHTHDTIWLPTRAVRAISKFDNGKGMKPFNFFLQVPEEEGG